MRMAKDPVCGMSGQRSQAMWTTMTLERLHVTVITDIGRMCNCSNKQVSNRTGSPYHGQGWFLMVMATSRQTCTREVTTWKWSTKILFRRWRHQPSRHCILQFTHKWAYCQWYRTSSDSVSLGPSTSIGGSWRLVEWTHGSMVHKLCKSMLSKFWRQGMCKSQSLLDSLYLILDNNFR